METALQTNHGPATWPAIQAIAWREWVRFFRQRSRVIGALATPVLFWVLLGFGADRVFAAPGSSGAEGIGYREYFFPGALVMILLFTAIFSTITVIDDRNEGFLQGVLVSPASRTAIVLGKVLGGGGIALVQGIVFLLLYPLVGGFPGVLAMLGAVVAMAGLAIALTGLGLVMAWRMDSTAGYHALMNILLMPMWFLSGAVFPAATAPLWMKSVMAINPLTYGHQLLSGLLLGENAPAGLVPTWAAVLIVIGFAAAMVAITARLANKPA
ncbi:MAG TPA: ABC transporter permease [Paracoccaceae bacterium]|nr:ABC transporter permease [Paracoccaceae bacterium]